MATQVADTIGAGDSYMSALIHGLLNRSGEGLAPSVLERIGNSASMAAAITVSRAGANPPTWRELKEELTRRQSTDEHKLPARRSVDSSTAVAQTA